MAIQGMGRLVSDPVVHQFGDKQMVQLRIASDRYDPKEENNKGVDFMDAKMWGPRSQALAEYTAKGSLIFIVGELEVEKWEDKDGGKRSKAVIRMRDFEFASKKPEASSQSKGAQSNNSDTPF